VPFAIGGISLIPEPGNLKLGLDRKTVRRALLKETLPVTHLSRSRLSKIDPFKSYIQERIKEYPRLCGEVVLREIQRQGYTGKIRILNEFLAGLKSKKKEVFLRIETPAGEQGQTEDNMPKTTRIRSAMKGCWNLLLWDCAFSEPRPCAVPKNYSRALWLHRGH